MKNVYLAGFVLGLSLSAIAGPHFDLKESDCSSIDIMDKQPNLKEHFTTALDQGDIGWCYGYVAADLISARVGTTISPVHVATNFNKYIRKNFFVKSAYEISSLLSGSASPVYQGGYIDWAIRNASSEGVICETSEADSEVMNVASFIMDNYNGPGQQYGLKLLEDMSKGKYSREALKDKNINEALSDIMASSCQELIHIPKIKTKNLVLPFYYKDEGLSKEAAFGKFSRNMKIFYQTIQNSLAYGQPVGITYEVSPISGFSGYHASSIVARKWENNKCQFKIRNSWGNTCTPYLKNKIESCDKQEGSYWVSSKVLEEMVEMITYTE